MRLFDDPLKTIVDGMVQAQGIRQQMLQARMEQARAKMLERDMAMRQEETQRDRQMKDIQFQQQLVQNARPVSGAGKVTERTQLDTRLEGLPSAMQPGVVDVQNERAVNPGGAVNFNGKQYELLSKEDLDARDMERARLMGAQQNSQYLDRFAGQAKITDQYNEKDRDLRRELQSGQISAREYIAEMQARAEAAKVLQQQDFQRGLEGMRQGFQSGENDKNRQTTLAAARIRRAGGGGGAYAGSDDPQVLAVLARPESYQSLTPTEKKRINPALVEAGFTNFGKDAAAGDIRKVGEIQSAIDEVGGLREAMKQGGDYVGPLAGWQTVNPWSGARALQAKVDAVRQRVGKALEGGVLRKEDEEKYKRILPTMFDTPATVEYKINELEKSLKNDMGNIQKAQQGVGRRAPQMGGAAPAGGGIDLSQFER